MSKTNNHHTRPKPQPKIEPKPVVFTDAEKRKIQYDALKDVTRKR